FHTRRLANSNPVSLGCYHDPTHNLPHVNEDSSHLFWRHLNHAHIMYLRNNKRMSGIQRVNIQECERMLILEDDDSSCFFRDDFAEDGVFIHGSIPLP